MTMKNKTKELNVDFIGGQCPLTNEEQKRISEFIKAQKSTQNKKQPRTSKMSL